LFILIQKTKPQKIYISIKNNNNNNNRRYTRLVKKVAAPNMPPSPPKNKNKTKQSNESHSELYACRKYISLLRFCLFGSFAKNMVG